MLVRTVRAQLRARALRGGAAGSGRAWLRGGTEGGGVSPATARAGVGRVLLFVSGGVLATPARRWISRALGVVPGHGSGLRLRSRGCHVEVASGGVGRRKRRRRVGGDFTDRLVGDAVRPGGGTILSGAGLLGCRSPGPLAEIEVVVRTNARFIGGSPGGRGILHGDELTCRDGTRGFAGLVELGATIDLADAGGVIGAVALRAARRRRWKKLRGLGERCTDGNLDRGWRGGCVVYIALGTRSLGRLVDGS